MKYLKSGMIFMLLFIVPFGSWYYLQSGLDYRKEALKELEPKGIFTVDGIDTKDFLKKTTLVQLKPLNYEVLPEVFDQYGHAETYQMMTVTSPVLQSPNWKVISPIVASSISAQYNNAGMMLIDTSGFVRNIYPCTAEGVTKMIEHTAIILPRIKEVDIKTRRNARK